MKIGPHEPRLHSPPKRLKQRSGLSCWASPIVQPSKYKISHLGGAAPGGRTSTFHMRATLSIGYHSFSRPMGNPVTTFKDQKFSSIQTLLSQVVAWNARYLPSGEGSGL